MDPVKISNAHGYEDLWSILATTNSSYWKLFMRSTGLFFGSNKYENLWREIQICKLIF